ncbi:beta-xylanase [Bacteroidia bacterium]|nr:beta-xylanase [Bacteroidia bacterium]
MEKNIKKYIPKQVKQIYRYLLDTWDSIYDRFRDIIYPNNSLKSAYKGKFLIGTSISPNCISDRKARQIITRHFNSVTSESGLKFRTLPTENDNIFFETADKLLKFSEKHKMFFVGHCLIGAARPPLWILEENNGKKLTGELVAKRMEQHIKTIVGRYKNRIKVWDVLNEAIADDGSLLNTPLYKISGANYIKNAFRFAREADPNCKLYYNDYDLSKESKRNGVVQMIKQLHADGVHIDGIGIQGHCHLVFPDIKEMEKSIVAFAEQGCKVSITEMDISILPVFNPYTDAKIALSEAYRKSLNPFTRGIPEKIAQLQSNRYIELFNLFLKHQDIIERVTLWGITDSYSRKNDAPIPGRTDYPLLFDRNYQAKPVVKELIAMAKVQRTYP